MRMHRGSHLQRLHAQVGNKVLSAAAQDRPSGGGRSSQGGDSGPLQGEAVRSSRSSLSGSHTDLASAASLGGTISAASLGGTFSAPQDIPGAVVGGQEGADLLHPEALFPQAHQVCVWGGGGRGRRPGGATASGSAVPSGPPGGGGSQDDMASCYALSPLHCSHFYLAS